MVTYILYGFRWNRIASPSAYGIRAYIAIANIVDAAAEYLQHPITNAVILDSFKHIDPNILTHLPDLQLIEQYDPDDLSADAVSQPYAYVSAKTLTMGAKALSRTGLGLSLQEIVQLDPGLSTAGTEVFKKLKDELAPASEIGWFVVYNGEPERAYESSDESSSVAEDEDVVTDRKLTDAERGKTRLAKWYAPYNDDEKVKLKGEVHRLIAPRDQKYQSNFVEFRLSTKIVYRRYAGLFFCVGVDANDNELAYLEAIHFFVEVLDQFFGNVCELDLVFNFYKVYAILDEVFLAGEIEETSKQVVLTRLEHLDKLE
ncbi:AP-2 complex subunit sigma [Paracoccidioides brasiliensis Pb18]|uniref:AP-2 complex subunit sigma n=2 Tax=Paracoccidioides brasiliensis TaxID=121759 RepID=A0A0A0HWF0_PARBD|nr:AP-2 complex subunit sigma [Paracoccidioides brasiliensis Pb18]KGM92698.1 AP-2 complex subunit sigma [Paracoccidioides brasiliensis Pb18]ODH38780.1 AP-2 complex subunit sigma [Paracoccidioides brasiliensis]ODH49491.1 AP-2 complex subunit sigma [Paracoccidioides brasiliensis]